MRAPAVDLYVERVLKPTSAGTTNEIKLSQAINKGGIRQAVRGGNEATVPIGEYPDDTAFRQEASDIIAGRAMGSNSMIPDDQLTTRQLIARRQRELDRKIEYLGRKRDWEEYGMVNELNRLEQEREQRPTRRQAGRRR